MKRTVTIAVVVLGVVLFLSPYAIAQDKVVVIPLFGDATGPPAPAPKTGQTGCWDASGNSISCAGTGQDGEYQTGTTPAVPPAVGISWTVQRFTDNGDGTIRDNLNGLLWLKNANCFGQRDWAPAPTDCNTLNSGECGLSDGSVEGEWRLPNINELRSLVEASALNPALPYGHPFTGVQSDYYWSSTTYPNSAFNAWGVGIQNGDAV